jgi:hypothetical protein
MILTPILTLMLPQGHISGKRQLGCSLRKYSVFWAARYGQKYLSARRQQKQA